MNVVHNILNGGNNYGQPVSEEAELAEAA